MSGDEQTPSDIKPSENPSNPGPKPAKAVFSDSFDNPHYGPAEDELPDDEPLTPELVEEEAIRGDFMLRWAAIFLAILMAFGKLTETKTLVLIKSGDEMRANGFLPVRKDTFSITMTDRPVENVSWLFDHAVSFAWMLGGPIGLTALKVLVAAVSSFLLMRISIPGVSTWWSSICMVFAIVAISQDFIPIPELATILGMTLVMRQLFLHRIGQSSGLVWKLPLLTAIWCNFDPRAWVGAGVIVMFAVGTSVAHSLAGRKETGANVNLPKSMLTPALLSVVALLVNPFHISSLLSPLTTYSIEYPAMQSQRSITSGLAAISFDQRVDWFPALNPTAIRLFDHTHVAGLAILFVAFVVMLLSRSARDTGLLFALLFVSFLTVLATHELPAAAIVGAVVASVSAQDWYRRSFNMKYSTDTRELLFSRGGRAVTVLALAGIGFCVVASRLPGRMPLGFGFDQDTQITIDTLSEQFKSIPQDARILHTRIEQGDVLIWNGRKSFVDSRVVPFGRPDDAGSVFGQHGNVLQTLMKPPVEEEPTSDPVEKDKRAATKAKNLQDAYGTLDQYEISHVAIRFAPPGLPDYTSVQVLSSSGQWLPVSVGASAAFLERIKGALTPEEFTRKAVSFESLAFRKEDTIPAGLRQFASPPNFYDRYLYRTRLFTDADKRLAMHYMSFSTSQPQSVSEALSGIAKITLGIRHLNKSLAVNPSDDESYVLLGRAYLQLGSVEQLIAGPNLPARLQKLRQIQALSVFRQATELNAENMMAWDGLFQIHQQLNHGDMTLEALTKWLELAEKQTQTDTQFEEFLTSRFLQRDDLEKQIEETEGKVAESIKTQLEQLKAADTNAGKVDNPAGIQQAAERDLLATVSIWQTSGFHKRALETIEADLPVAQASPFGRFLYGNLLLDAGQLEEANRTLIGISQEAIQNPNAVPGVEWQLPTAISQMAVCDYDSAIDTWSSEVKVVATNSKAADHLWTVAHTMPLVADAHLLVNSPLPVWPFHNINAVGTAAQTANELPAELMFLVAMAQLEKGSNSEARKTLAKVISEFGNCRARPLASAYYALLDEKAVDLFMKYASDNAEEFIYPGEKFPEPATTPGAPGTAPGQPANTVAPGTGPIAPPATGAKQPQ